MMSRNITQTKKQKKRNKEEEKKIRPCLYLECSHCNQTVGIYSKEGVVHINNKMGKSLTSMCCLLLWLATSNLLQRSQLSNMFV